MKETFDMMNRLWIPVHVQQKSAFCKAMFLRKISSWIGPETQTASTHD